MGQTTWQRIQIQRQEDEKAKADKLSKKIAKEEAKKMEAEAAAASRSGADGDGGSSCCDCLSEHKRRNFKTDAKLKVKNAEEQLAAAVSKEDGQDPFVN